MKVKGCCIVLFFLFAFQAFGQEESGTTTGTGNRIGDAVDAFVQAHKHKIGIFRTYGFLGFHVGFDPNSVFGNRNKDQEEDFFFSVDPGISGGVKFGSRAFLRVIEQLRFLYYHKQEQRRDIFNTTLAEFVTGTPGVLVTFNGGYERNNGQVNEEVDEPVDHKVIHGSAKVEYSATDRIEMSHSIRLAQTTFVPTEESLDSSLTLHDQRSLSFGTGTSYALKQTIQLTGNFNINRSESSESDIIRHSWTILGGVSLNRANLSGGLGFGFGRADSGLESDKRSNFLFDTHIESRLFRHKLILGGIVNRRYEFSFLEADAIRVTTQGGVRFTSPLASHLTLDGYYTIGKNDYGNTPIAGQTIKQDNFQTAALSVGIQTFRFLSIHPGIGYLKRDTDIPDLSKENFGFFVTIGAGTALTF